MIIEKNGKRYLQSFVAKINNQTLDMSDLFADIEKARKECAKGKRFIKKNEEGAILQRLVNRFSGDYFSPSMLTSYTDNPAWAVLRDIFDQGGTSIYVEIGNDFHKAMEDYYKLEIKDRNKQYIDFIPNETKHFDTVKELCDNYANMNDYLTNKPITDNFECENELYIKHRIEIPSANYTLPFDISCMIDRLDKRKQGNYVIDYKTGKYREYANTFDGYLSAMLLYKLAFEQHLNTEIKGGFLCFPKDMIWSELDFSKENEIILAEKIKTLHEQMNIDAKRRVYTYTDKGFFNNRKAYKFRNIMNDSNIFMAKIPIEIEL